MKKYLLITCSVFVLLCACGRVANVDNPTVIPATSSNWSPAVSTSPRMPEFDVSAMDIELTFDDFLDVWNSYAGIDMNYYYENAGINNFTICGDFSISYRPDYQEYLEGVIDEISDDYFIYQVPGYEYHITRQLCVGSITISEFDNYESAETMYREQVWTALVGSRDETSDSMLSDGFCFRMSDYGDHEFSAFYLVDNCVISFVYTFENSNNELYQQYLDVFEMWGLPVSNEATERILRVS